MNSQENTQSSLAAFTLAALSDQTLFSELSAASSMEAFVKLATDGALSCGINLSSCSFEHALSVERFLDEPLGDTQLDNAAGFGYGQYACTDNSNFTAQRPSCCMSCNTVGDIPPEDLDSRWTHG